MTTIARLRPDTNDVVDGAFALGLGALALYAFQSSFGGLAYLTAGIIGLIAGVVLAHATTKLRQPVIVLVAGIIVVYVVLGSAIALRNEALGGVFPTPTSLRDLLTGAIHGWIDLLTTAPPVGGAGNLLALPFLCGIVAGAGGLALARRTTTLAWPATPAAVVLAVGILFGTPTPVSLALHGALFGAIVVAWAALRYQRTRPTVVYTRTHRRYLGALAILCVAGLGAMAVGPHLPLADARSRFTLRDEVEPPFDPSLYPSPLNGFRNYVVNHADDVLMTVRGLPKGARIRLATMDVYDGLVWGVAGGSSGASGSSGYFQRVGDTIPGAPNGTRADVSFTAATLTGVWLPDGGAVNGITFGGPRAPELADAFRYNRASATAVVTSGLRPGDRWSTSVVLPPEPTEALASVPKQSIVQPELSNVPDDVKAFGADLVGDLTGAYERVQKLTDELRSRGYYSDGKDGQQLSAAGHGAGRLTAFVKANNLIGDAEQYAATMALMARALGLPARVVMGFAPTVTGDGPVDVKGSDVTAWVEIDFAGVGWVPFDPTPDKNKTTVDEVPKPKPNPKRQTQVAPPPPVVQPDTQTPHVDQGAADPQKERPKQTSPNKHDSGGSLPVAAIVGGVLLLPIVALLTTALAIIGWKARRRSRRRRRGPPSHRVANGWREVTDLARDLGRPIPPAATRREAAAHLGHERALPLALAADAVVFGPEAPTDASVFEYWGQVDDVRRAMREEHPALQRLRAALNITSLRKAT
jgi:transglutaminase-like putative cysteine protease